MNMNNETFRCWNCGGDAFFEGPHGGDSVNFACKTCHAWYNDMGAFGIAQGGFAKLQQLADHFHGDYTPRSTQRFPDRGLL